MPLSTAYGRDSVYLAFHTNPQTDHTDYFARVEQVLRGYDGRPHWGKLHTRTAADLAPAYPRWQDFLAMRDRLDPDRHVRQSIHRACPRSLSRPEVFSALWRPPGGVAFGSV